MAENLKQVRLFDLNLFTGSSELIRQEFKGIHYNFNGLAFESANKNESTEAVVQYNFESYAGFEGREYKNFDPMPYLQYAVQFFGYEANIKSDEEWSKYFIGGAFGDKQYPGVYNSNVYSDHFINLNILPYKPSETSLLNNTVDPGIVLTTEYYQYYQRYQNYVDTLESELMIPNYYLLDTSLFAVSSSDLNFPRHQYLEIKQYLNNVFVNEDNQLDDSLSKKNIFLLNSNFIQQQNDTLLETDSNYIKSEEDLSKIYSLMPFGNKIEISSELANAQNGNLFKTAIEESSFEYKFIKILKEAFQGEISLSPSTVNFGLNVVEQKSINETSYGTSETTQTVPLRVLDLPNTMVYCYKNAISETNDDFVIDSENFEQQIKIFSDSDGAYRHIAVEKTLETFNKFRNIISQNFKSPNKIDDLENLLNQANETKYTETMAFRIEKIGGLPTGDSRTQNTIQNIWFYNRNDAVKYLDTQIKYNTNYTYKIFSYVLVQGYKYQLSDLIVSRRLSQLTDMPNQVPVYCLELYDPFSGATRPRKSATETISPSLESLIREFRDTRADQSSRLITVDGLLSRYEDFANYLADSSFSRPAPYITSSIFIEDTELQTYFFDEEVRPFVTIAAGVEAAGGLGEFFSLEDRDGDGDVDLDDLTSEQREIYDETYENLINSLPTVTNENKDEIRRIVEAQQFSAQALSSSFVAAIADTDEILDGLDPFSNVERNDLFNLSQILIDKPYSAQVDISIEPSVKIIEIPLDEKLMRVIDHPPNDVVVSPYHLMDQSNRLGFYMKYDTFSANTVSYPSPITEEDTQNKTSYEIGKDFVTNSKTKEESVSPARFIEVYRTDKKPTSYASFDGSLRKSIDLQDDSGDISSDLFYKDFVETNKKYYYVFRVANSNGVAGTPSMIFESELIDDGGYVYGSFTQLSESELIEAAPSEPTISFKKLINIVPNIQHLTLNTNAEMFSDASTDHLGDISLGTQESTDEFWDQKFKIRLTSKKTGRKIDLNLKFEKKVSK